ncbi:hypothetical protein SELMODRAFT_432074 [Selaginella moellendorffii]|uniref:Uncharacterized protein n=1 Tax=Selaginella moellendorffii TaxID=88036 RepID=D8TEW8_SELML|nr:hypothetical protein SELMODRAFT_432074 [Selaginella moellendorffii]
MFSLAICLKVVLLVRPFIHDKFGTNNLTFLFNQVVHQHLKYPEHDPWCCRARSAEYERGYRYTWSGPLILDDEVPNWPIYIRKWTQPIDAGQVCCFSNTVYFAGRGRSLLRVATQLAKTPKHRHVNITNLGGFRNSQALQQFAARILDDCSILDFQRLQLLFQGRHRTFATALENCIMVNPLASELTQMLMVELGTKRGVVASSVVDRRRILFSINRTVLDDIYSFFAGVPSSEAEAAKASVQSAVMNMFFGSRKMVAINPTLSLIEFGLARVVYKGEYGKRVQWIQDGEDIVGDGDKSWKTPLGVESEDFRLLDWIESVQNRHGFSYTFFSTADNANAGPDIWFFLNLVDDKDGDEELTIKNPKDAKAAKLIQDFPHHVKLVVTSAYMNLEKVQKLKLVQFDHSEITYKGRSTIRSMPPIQSLVEILKTCGLPERFWPMVRGEIEGNYIGADRRREDTQ